MSIMRAQFVGTQAQHPELRTSAHYEVILGFIDWLIESVCDECAKPAPDAKVCDACGDVLCEQCQYSDEGIAFCFECFTARMAESEVGV
jgi:hypothetical protein